MTDRSARPTPARARSARRTGTGGTLVGLFIGLALGLGLAAAVAFYVIKAGNPYQPSVASSAREAGKEQGRSGRPDSAASDKPRFDFYKILPGTEEPKVQARTLERPSGDKATLERAAVPEKGAAKIDDHPAASATKAPEPPPRAPRSTERIWLQAGSFSAEDQAEHLKAQLALSGVEATMQQATLPDKAVRYRIRLGPYDNVDEALRAKADLAKRGFDVTVIR